MAIPHQVVVPSSADLLHGVWWYGFVRPMEIVSTIVSFVLLVTALIVAIPVGLVNQLLHPTHPKSAWNEIFRAIFHAYLFAAGIRVEAMGTEHLPAPHQPVLLAANHPGHFDGPVMDLAVGDRRATAMTAPFGYFPWPFSFWFARIGGIDVARTAKEERKYPTAKTRKQALELMIYQLTKLKKTMLIFPEGHVEKHRHPTPPKTGAIRIAIRAQVPLIPVTIRGTERVFSPNQWLLHPGRIQVVFHPPLPLPEDPQAVEDHDLVRMLTSQLLCVIAKDLPPKYYTPGLLNACKEMLKLHPVTRAATKPRTKRRSPRR